MNDQDTTAADFDLIVLDEIDCARCGVRFGAPKQLFDKRRLDGETFYCPNGHGVHFEPEPPPRDVELDRLRDTLAAERAARTSRPGRAGGPSSGDDPCGPRL